MILDKEFYKQGALTLAKELLGKVVVRTVDNVTLKARIVETEAYIGEIDKASHAYNGRRTERTQPLFREGGIAYVYFIYGKYYCFNVISGVEDKGEGVLIRALEPLNEFDYLAQKRFNQNYDELTESKKKAITNGPSKLCMAFSIDKSENYIKLYEGGDFYVESPRKIYSFFSIIYADSSSFNYIKFFTFVVFYIKISFFIKLYIIF